MLTNKTNLEIYNDLFFKGYIVYTRLMPRGYNVFDSETSIYCYSITPESFKYLESQSVVSESTLKLNEYPITANYLYATNNEKVKSLVYQPAPRHFATNKVTNKNAALDLNFIVQRIEEIASKNCKDYPELETTTAYEKLWAIESTLTGLDGACDDLHAVIKDLFSELNWDEEQQLDYIKNYKPMSKKVN